MAELILAEMDVMGTRIAVLDIRPWRRPVHSAPRCYHDEKTAWANAERFGGGHWCISKQHGGMRVVNHGMHADGRPVIAGYTTGRTLPSPPSTQEGWLTITEIGGERSEAFTDFRPEVSTVMDKLAREVLHRIFGDENG